MIFETNQPLVSVVLPTYNRAYILSKAIESVLAQTYTNWELIIVDDGSTDTTREIIAGFSNPRIRYIKHEANKGLAAARNTGIRNARGKYIANLDSDDVWMPKKLEKEMRRFTPGIDVVYSGYDRTLPNGRTLHLPHHPKEGNLKNDFLESNIIGMVMSTVRKEIFFKYGMFDESVQALQDWELWLRVAPHCQFVFVPEVLVTGSILQDSIASDHTKRLRSREQIFSKHEQLFCAVPAVYAKHAYSIGHAYALRGNIPHALPYLKKAYRSQPFRMRYLAACILAWITVVLRRPNIYKQIAAR